MLSVDGTPITRFFYFEEDRLLFTRTMRVLSKQLASIHVHKKPEGRYTKLRYLIGFNTESKDARLIGIHSEKDELDVIFIKIRKPQLKKLDTISTLIPEPESETFGI